MSYKYLFYSLSILFLTGLNTVHSQNFNNKENQKLWRVGIEIDPPFVLKDHSGKFSGISIELWKRVASQLNINYEFVLVPSGIPFEEKYKNTDIVSTLSVRLVNEQRYDCTHPYLNTGLGIATRKEENGVIDFLSGKILTILLVFLSVLIVAGILAWLIERKNMPNEFGGTPVKGIIKGTIWAIETIVGREKSLSQKPLSRFFHLNWLIACLVIVSFFTAKLSSELTIHKLDTIKGPEDLDRLRIGYQGGIARDYLQDRYLVGKEYRKIEDAIDALCKNEIDAVVYPAPNLLYHAKEKYTDQISVLPSTFANFGFGIGLPLNFEHTKSVNVAILTITKTHDWNAYVFKTLNNANEN